MSDLVGNPEDRFPQEENKDFMVWSSLIVQIINLCTKNYSNYLVVLNFRITMPFVTLGIFHQVLTSLLLIRLSKASDYESQ